MDIYAIGDLHLAGLQSNKSMEKFNWINHWENIKIDWKERVRPNDVVLLAGDISWSLNMSQIEQDLKEIDELPGVKIIVKGNHDLWWSTMAKMKKATPPSISYLYNNHYEFGNYAICGSRGWKNKNDKDFTEHDMGVYVNEKRRLITSLESAKLAGYENIIVLMHYPLFQNQETDVEDNEMYNIIKGYNVKHFIYGHLHGKESIYGGFVGGLNGTNHHLVSCDALKFKLKKIVRI